MRELYEQYPDSRQGLEEGGFDVAGLLARLEKNRLDFSAEGLDAIDSADLRRDLAVALAFLPPVAVVERFGEHALLWAWVSCPYLSGKNSMLKALVGRSKDPDLLEKARRTRWVTFHDARAGNVLRAYNMFRQLDQQTVNLQDVLQISAKTVWSSGRLQDYGVEGVMPEGKNEIGYVEKFERVYSGSRDKYFGIFLDAPFGFVLKYRGEPNAVVGFNFANQDSLMICQLQGVHPRKLYGGMPVKAGGSRGLAALDWEKALVEYVARWAVQEGFSELGIQSGANNKWAKPDAHEEVHLPLERALARYDGTARRLEFTQRENGDWYKKIKN